MNDIRQYLFHAKTPRFASRVAQARRIFLQGAQLGRMLVGLSWGKDSGALGHLAIDAFAPERVQVLHLLGGAPLPGHEEVAAYFAERCDVHSPPRRLSFEEYVEYIRTVGLPHERTKSEQKRVVKHLKVDPGDAFANEHKFAVRTLGFRIAEGGPRAIQLKRRGPIYQLADGSWRCCPLAYWDGLDVWAYTFANAIPYNRRIYDAESFGMTRETIRNTGWLSTDGAHDGRIVWLRRHFPEQYDALARAFPQVRHYR